MAVDTAARRTGRVGAGLIVLAGGLLGSPAAAEQPDWTGTTYTARTNYVLRCSGCHGLEGRGGERGGVPDLRDHVGAFAGEDDGRTYVVKVPGVRNSNLSPEATAAVLNYVMTTFAGASFAEGTAPFTAEEVVRRRQIAVGDIVAYRRTIAARLAAEGVPLAGYPWP
jgi:Cytochrome c.